MPSLNKPNVQKVYLPSTENEPNEADRGWAIVDASLTVGSLVGIDGVSSQLDQAIAILVHAIKEWNLTETPESTTIAPINEQTISMLSPADFGKLSQIVSQSVTDQTGGVDTSLKGN